MITKDFSVALELAGTEGCELVLLAGLPTTRRGCGATRHGCSRRRGGSTDFIFKGVGRKLQSLSVENYVYDNLDRVEITAFCQMRTARHRELLCHGFTLLARAELPHLPSLLDAR